MNITEFITRLKAYVEATIPREEDLSPESLLEMLFNVYTEFNGFDNQVIREDFNDLYTAMNGKTLREMDQIIYPVCTLCRDHEKTGFQEGVKVGIRLAQEANIELNATEPPGDGWLCEYIVDLTKMFNQYTL